MPAPVSMNSINTSSARSGLTLERTVRVPREFIASIAFNISAMKLWISRSGSPATRGRLGPNLRSTDSRLKRS